MKNRSMRASLIVAVVLLSVGTWCAFAQPAQNDDRKPIRVGNVFPHATVIAPGVGSTSETGIGAMIPWADRLWIIGYVAHIKGDGIGLYELREDMTFTKHPASVTGTFANRLVHWESSQVFIGPHAIDEKGNVRTIEALKKHRLTSTCRHLTAPEKMVYFLTMEGLLFECDVNTLECKQLADCNVELNLPKGAQPHYKGAFSAQGRLVVANNTYEKPEFLGTRRAGRLAEWDGKTWTVLEENPFIEVSGKQNPRTGNRYGNTLFALGWDNASVILRVLHDGKWSRYRLPQGGHEWDHTWNTEWMRIREVQTERYLMDAFGLFYHLPPMVYGGKVWGIRPISTHLRICPDMVFFRGMLVLAGDQTDNAVGQPQSGLWFGNIDDLWKWGKPTGWGAVWRKTPIEADTYSDPFLMTGFDKKVLHLTHDARRRHIHDRSGFPGRRDVEDLQGNHRRAQWLPAPRVPRRLQRPLGPCALEPCVQRHRALHLQLKDRRTRATRRFPVQRITRTSNALADGSGTSATSAARCSIASAEPLIALISA